MAHGAEARGGERALLGHGRGRPRRCRCAALRGWRGREPERRGSDAGGAASVPAAGDHRRPGRARHLVRRRPLRAAPQRRRQPATRDRARPVGIQVRRAGQCARRPGLRPRRELLAGRGGRRDRVDHRGDAALVEGGRPQRARRDPGRGAPAVSATETIAFTLRLLPGATAEYKRRHDELWPEMRALLLGAGILRYEIYLHEETGLLFAHIERLVDHRMGRIPDDPVSKRWQKHMEGLIEQVDGRPVRDVLPLMFRLSAA
ncbi:MAG: L-rhamnose mutarotase [Alphaproteobacteria bacterium]|nr:L-rhamnose mutarotase [Alphaproteobacteria bacterium]